VEGARWLPPQHAPHPALIVSPVAATPSLRPSDLSRPANGWLAGHGWHRLVGGQSGRIVLCVAARVVGVRAGPEGLEPPQAVRTVQRHSIK
jgi:hypothetical protein